MIDKNKYCFCILILFFLTGLFIPSKGLFAGSNVLLPSFQITGSISAGYAYNKDINNAAEGKADFYADYLNASVAGADDSFSTKNTRADFTYGLDFGLRYYYRNFGIGAESGYHMAEAESEASSPDFSNKATITLGLAVIPVTATFYYRMPVVNKPGLFLLAGAGLGYYLGTVKGEYKNVDEISGDNSFSYTDDNTTIGFHAIFECNYVINDKGETLFTGLKGRYVEFDGFEQYGHTITDGASLTGIIWYAGAAVSI